MNVLHWMVLLHCVYRASNCCLSVYIDIAGLQKSHGKCCGCPGKVLEFFVSKRVGTLLHNAVGPTLVSGRAIMFWKFGITLGELCLRNKTLLESVLVQGD